MKKRFLLSKVVTCVALVFAVQTMVQCAPKPIPKLSEIPNDSQDIDAAINQLEKRIEGLKGMKYAKDDDAMQHEFQGWEDYQGDLNAEDNIDNKIAQLQEELDALKAKKAKLSK